MKQETKVDYNIEYAHIYTDENFGIEHKKSIEKLHTVIDKLKKLDKSYVLTVLIDEYNPKYHGLNIKKFLEELEKFGAKPDFVGFESRLTPYKDLILKEIKGKIKKEYENYIKKHGKIPCSLLITIWHLKRLGLIKTKNEEVKYLNNNNRPFIARKIITILPKKYQTVEIKALNIIKSTRFKKYLRNISNVFFD